MVNGNNIKMNQEHFTFQYDYKDLGLDISRVESVLGYGGEESGKAFRGLISGLLDEAAVICNIKAEYRIVGNIEFDNEHKTINIKDLSFDVRKIVFNQLKKSESLAVFLCTAGPDIGKRSRKAMKEGDMLKGYIYDVIGSMVVEAAADLMQDSLEEAMLISGKKITNRFSPGYCGWDVSEQHKLFSLMDNNHCGIILSASALMDPMKSVSGIIGIGNSVKKLPYTCGLCNMKDCIYRKEKNQGKEPGKQEQSS
jgi:hypothetical protein